MFAGSQYRECKKQYLKELEVGTLTVNDIKARCSNLNIDGNLAVCNGDFIVQEIVACDLDFPINVVGNVVFRDNVVVEGTLFVCDIVVDPNCNGFCDNPLRLSEITVCPGSNGLIINTNVIITGNLEVCRIDGTNCPNGTIIIGPNVEISNITTNIIIVSNVLEVCNIFASLNCPNMQINIGPNVNISNNLIVNNTLFVCDIDGSLCPNGTINIGPNVFIENNLIVNNTLFVCDIDGTNCPNGTINIGPNVFIENNLTVNNTLFVCDIDGTNCPNGTITIGPNVFIENNLIVNNTLFVCTIDAGICPNNTIFINANNVVFSNTLVVCDISASGCPNNTVTIGPNVIISNLTVCDINAANCPNNTITINGNTTITNTLTVCDISGLGCPNNTINIGPNVNITNTLDVCNISALGCPNNSVTIGPNVNITNTLTVCDISGLGCPNNTINIGPNVNITNTLDVCNISALGCPNNSVTIGPNVNITNTLTVCDISGIGCPNNTITIGPNVSITNTLNVCNIACPDGNLVIGPNTNLLVCQGTIFTSTLDTCSTNIDVLNTSSSPGGSTQNFRVCAPTTLRYDVTASCSGVRNVISGIQLHQNDIVMDQFGFLGGDPCAHNLTVNHIFNDIRAVHNVMTASLARAFNDFTFTIPSQTWTTVPFNSFFGNFGNCTPGSEQYSGGLAWQDRTTFQIYNNSITGFNPITFGPPAVPIGDPNLAVLLTFGTAPPSQLQFNAGILINLSTDANYLFLLRYIQYLLTVTWSDAVGQQTGLRAVRYILYNADSAVAPFTVTAFFGPTSTIDAQPLLVGTVTDPGGRIQNLNDFNPLTSTPAFNPNSPNGQGRWAVQMQIWGDVGGGVIQVNSGATDQTSLTVNAWS